MSQPFPIEFDPNDTTTIAKWTLRYPCLNWDPRYDQLPRLLYQVTEKVTRRVISHECLVKGVLGRGGFGIVFHAEHPDLGPLAIKIPRRRYTDTSNAIDKDKEEQLEQQWDRVARGVKLTMSDSTLNEFLDCLSDRRKENSQLCLERLNQEIVDRFRLECGFLQRIDHSHVVKVHHAGEVGHRAEDGQWKGLAQCLVMEFLDSRKLVDLIRAQKQNLLESDLPTIITLMKQVALGCSAIHDAGSPHRDLSYNNIVVQEGPTPQAVIVDLGNASGIIRNPGSVFWDNSAILDILVTGTPGFIAEEQRGGLPHPVSDQFSLGVALYHWMAGSFPFDPEDYQPNGDDGPIDMIAKVPNADSWSPKNRRALEQLSRLVMQCLKPRTADRHPSMRDLAAEFEMILMCLGEGSCSPLTLSEAFPMDDSTQDQDARALPPRADNQHDSARDGAIVLTAFARQCRIQLEHTIASMNEVVSEILEDSMDLDTFPKALKKLSQHVTDLMDRVKHVHRCIQKVLKGDSHLAPCDIQFGGELQRRIDRVVDVAQKLLHDALQHHLRSSRRRIHGATSGSEPSEVPGDEMASEYADFLESIREGFCKLGDCDFHFAVYILLLRDLIAERP